MHLRFLIMRKLAFTGVLAENSPKPTKKKRKQVDPSSLVKNVKNETRIEKRKEGSSMKT